jgi:hypothetical protein
VNKYLDEHFPDHVGGRFGRFRLAQRDFEKANGLVFFPNSLGMSESRPQDNIAYTTDHSQNVGLCNKHRTDNYADANQDENACRDETEPFPTMIFHDQLVDDLLCTSWGGHSFHLNFEWTLTAIFAYTPVPPDSTENHCTLPSSKFRTRRNSIATVAAAPARN